MTDNGNAAQNKKDALARYLVAKFGLFVHWGPYSVAGVEASWPIMAPELAAAAFGPGPPISEADYVLLPQRFNPTDFDAHTWVRLARQAGMRYIVFTAKHHDGFCMFDAPGTDYKVTRTPYGRDICAELAEACAEGDMDLGFYYSPPDMHHPGYRDVTKPAAANWLGEPGRKGWAGYLDYMESHVRKLLTDYGPVRILWFDGLSGHEKYDPPRFHRLIQELSPNTLVNDRLGGDYDYITPEQFIPRRGIPVKHELPRLADGHFRALLALFKVPGVKTLLKRWARKYAEGSLQLGNVPTESYPSPDRFQPWETCMTMNRTWAYNPADDAYRPAAELIYNLVEIASRGGNYLLNVGPSPLGTFPPEAVARLSAIGRWMAVNGESIHGSTYGPLQHLLFGRTTAKEDAIYLHIYDWPSSGRISLGAMPGLVSEVVLLAEDRSLPFQQRGNHFTIEVSAEAPDPVIPVLAIRLKPSQAKES